MLTVTHAYGERRHAKVLDRQTIEPKPGRGKVDLLVLEDERGEGHVLVGTGSDGQPGDVGTITFTDGGPLGGYWKFSKKEANP